MKNANLYPLKAIRAKCLDCSGDSSKAVKWCSATDCALWPFRFGLRLTTARKRLGPELLNPDTMPESQVNLDDLPT